MPTVRAPLVTGTLQLNKEICFIMASLSDFNIVLPDRRTITFKLYGQEIPIPELTLDVLEKVQDELQAIEAGMHWVDYAKVITKFLAKALDLPLDAFSRISVPEMQGLSSQMNELLRFSGFTMADENPLVPEGENPGTGTSTQLPLNLQPKESAAETLNGSSEVIP
jgi:hypothetical protein